MKKFSALILAIIFAALPLCSCIKDDGPGVSENGITLFDEPIVVADASGTYFEIAKPSASTEAIDLCLSSLAKPADGFTLKHSVAKESDNESGDKEILLGNTCRPQSKAAMAEIGYDGYSLTYADGKIVIAAHNPERLAEAVEYLKANLLKVNDGKLDLLNSIKVK